MLPRVTGVSVDVDTLRNINNAERQGLHASADNDVDNVVDNDEEDTIDEYLRTVPTKAPVSPIRIFIDAAQSFRQSAYNTFRSFFSVPSSSKVYFLHPIR